MGQASGGFRSASSDCRKMSMEGGESGQQLTISWTFTPRAHAAWRSAESMAGQYLPDGTGGEEERTTQTLQFQVELEEARVRRYRAGLFGNAN